MKLHILATRHKLLTHDAIGRVMICQHLWPPWRYRTNWHAYYAAPTADGWGKWRDISNDEIGDVVRGQLPESWGHHHA